MILGFPNGFSPSDTFDVAEKVECWFVSTDACGVGQAVMIDFGAGAAAGRKVLLGTNANDHNAAGIYEGFGFPTGALSTITGLSGRGQKASVAADVIRVTVFGPAVSRLSATVTADAGLPCGITGGNIMAVATAAGCGNLGITLIGTATGENIVTATATTTATQRVWCKLM